MLAFQTYLPGVTWQNRTVHCCATAVGDTSQRSTARINLSVCAGPTCSKEKHGKQVFATLHEILRNDVSISVEKVGCLGECGNGPNVGICQKGMPPTIESGLREPVLVVEFAERIAGRKLDEKLCSGLLRKDEGNVQFLSGDLSGALSSYTTAVVLLREFSAHLTSLVLCNRSAVLLELGDVEKSLADANAAIDLEGGLAVAWKRKGLAHEALVQRESAIAALQMWVRLEGTKSSKQEADKRIKALGRRRWF